MVPQKQYNLRQQNNPMTDCMSLVQLVRFLNQTIYKLWKPPQNKSSFFAIESKCPAPFSDISLSAAVTVWTTTS